MDIFIDDLFNQKERTKNALSQRQLYYARLTMMEDEHLKQELQIAKEVKELQEENNEMASQLNDSDDWSADTEESDERSDPPSSSSNIDKVELLNRELVDYENKVEELKSVEEDISLCSKELVQKEMSVPNLQQVEELSEKIKQLTAENEDLRKQVVACNSLKMTTKAADLEPKLLKFLDEHKDELTLEFLEKCYEALLSIKASNPDKDFQQCINELKRGHSDYIRELAELKISKKEAEIKLQLLRRKYEDELSSFNEIRIQHLFKNSGAQEYLDRIKEKNKINNEIINSLRTELSSKQSELTALQNKFQDAEKQCNVYWQAWKDTQVKKEQLEAEKRAQIERDRRVLNQSMNMSCSSSLADNQVPPPPPISIPTVDEIYRMTSNQQANPYHQMSSLNYIPPPPPVDVPMNEILRQVRTSSSSVSGGDYS